VPRRLIAGRRAGDLESEILEQLSSARTWLSGREVWERLGGEDRAYTTVVTVLGRLVEKGLVERVSEPPVRRARPFRLARRAPDGARIAQSPSSRTQFRDT
jgi:hypothetical protein